MLELWFGTFIVEGLLFGLPVLWRFRRPVALVCMAYMLAATGMLWLKLGFVVGLPLGFLALFRLGNLARIVRNRMNKWYLRRVAARTSLALFLFHPLMFGLFVLTFVYSSTLTVQYLQAGQLIAAVGILATTLRNIAKLKFKLPESYLSDRELPTVTVAIPARNETDDLQACLRSVIANDYPKLEIIVLDDCSQGRTAEIIRSFAQDGVRFVQGEPPAERWLAKNQAYQKLYEEASGDLIMFCGVDVRLGTHAIRSMVDLLHSRSKAMLSVLPTRGDSAPRHAFIQPMRYWWELVLPRRLFNKPPVLSTCWLISRAKLKKLGGFAAVCHTILPEGFFARELVKTDEYSFVRSSDSLEVKTVKNLQEQYNTAIRNRYPQIRRRPEWALILTLINVIFLLLPFGLLVSAIWWHAFNVWIVAVTCVLLTLTHVAVVNITDPANSLLAIVSFPLVAFSELVVGYTSMIQYEFFTISWKDRNICIPVMHVVPHLPKA